MRQKSLLKTMLLLCALIVGSGSAWANNVELTSTSGFISNYSTNHTFTFSDIGFKDSGIMYNGKGTPNGWAVKQLIQMRKSASGAGEIYNTTEINTITSVEVTLATANNEFTVYYGTSEAPSTNSIASSSLTPVEGTFSYTNTSNGTSSVTSYKFTFDLSDYHPTYIKIVNGTKANYVTSIVINYEESSGDAPTLESITVSGTPTKAIYKAGEYFDPTGLTVTATYSDESTEIVSVNDATWEPGPTTPLTAGTTQVSATYKGIQSNLYSCITVKPTYTVTYDANGGSGAMTDQNSPYVAGDEVTLLSNAFTAPFEKVWDSWLVKDASDNLISVSDGKFEMPASNVTVTAQWVDIPKYTAHFSVNGIIDDSNDCTVAEGVSITFPTNPAAIDEKVFVGWVTTVIVGTTNTEPTFVTSATMGNSDITFYAVFAEATDNGSGTYTLDYSKESALSSSTEWGAYGKAFSYTATDGGSWTVKAYKNAGMQLNTGKDCSIKVPDCPGNITSVSITCSAAKAVGFSANDYTGSGTITYLAEGTDAKSQTLDLSEDNVKGGYIVPKSGSTSITKIVVNYGSITYSDYCTTVVAATVAKPVITLADNPFLFSTTATITCTTEGASIKYRFDDETWSDYSDALPISSTTTIYAKAIKGSDESSVVSVTATKNLAEPTVTIDATGITNTNVFDGTDAGSLSATVTYNDLAIDGATVTWSGDNNDVATIDPSTGAVTLVAAGTVTFTATYAENSDYSGKTATHQMTVVSPSITVDPATVNAPFEGADGTLSVSYENAPNLISFDIQFCDANGDELEGDPDWIDAAIELVGEEGYTVSYAIGANEGEARTAYFKVYTASANNRFYSNLVTINQAAYVAPPTLGNWVGTSLADINENDVFVIVGNNGSTYAMTNNNSTSKAPDVVEVTVIDNTLSGTIADNIKWNVTYDTKNEGYIFNPNGSTETWLYCINDNNGVRVGTNNNKLFTIDNGYLKNKATSRYVGIYNSQDWRCYTNTTGNIANQTFTFYKKLAAKLNASGYATFSATVPVDFSLADGFSAWAITAISGTSITFSQITGAVPANTGVLLKGATGETVYPAATASGTALSSNLLEAITTATSIEEGKYYGLSGERFVKVNAGTIPAGKALLPASAVPSGARLTFVFEEANGISAVESVKTMAEGYYNLQGQRIDTPKKGLYIVNGKKVIIK